MCPRAGESIILRTMCPHSNIEMMLSPLREHHLQLTKITTIGNCVLVSTRTLILKHMLSWRREHHSRGRLFSTCWSSSGACNSAIESRCESKSRCESSGLCACRVHSVLVGTRTHTSQLQCDTLDPHIVRHPRGKRKKRTAEILYGMQLKISLIAKAICKTIVKTKAIQVRRPLG